MAADVRAHAEELRASGTPFVLATVVRAERPTSAKPGARAVIHADGSMVGFVGGDCAQASVRTQALAVLASGEPVLLRIMPGEETDGTVAQPAHDGVVTVHNPCLSGGTLEVFLEPTGARRRMVVVGDSPIAGAVADLARHLGYDVSTDVFVPGSPEAIVVASHGQEEAEPLIAAVRAGVRYIGLVASRRRGPEVLAALELTAEQRSRIHTPAGIDIHAHSPNDIAVSILAEIIAAREGMPVPAAALPVQQPATAVDPVCGMTVATVETTLHADVDGVRYWFCAPGCMKAFTADPAAFAPR